MSQQINLFNPIFLKEKKHFSAKTMVQGLALIVACTLLLFGYSQYRSWALNEEAQKTSNRLKEARQQQANLTAGLAARKRNQQLEDDVTRAEQELGSMQQAFKRLQEEQQDRLKGYSDYLRAFARQIVPGVWLTGFSIDDGGKAIGIQGGALQPDQVPAYLDRLKQEPALQGKSFATLEIREPKEKEAKPGEAGGAKDAKKTPATPVYVEFDLRAAGVEKPAARQENAASASVPATAPPQSAPAPSRAASAASTGASLAEAAAAAIKPNGAKAP